MALSISTTNSVKPMAISTITSPPSRNSSLSSSSSFYDSHQSTSPQRQSFYPSTAPSPPESPTYRNSSSSQHYQKYSQQLHHRHSIPFYNPGHYLMSDSDEKRYHRNPNSDNCLSRTSSISSLQVAPLSLQERRQRNKAASAKYRAKKNQQNGEMRSHILALSKENDLLQRQLDHVRGENNRLKATCDRLRGKMLAEKMLKNLLNGKGEEGEEEEEDENMELAEDYSMLDDAAANHDMQYRKEQRAAMLKRFDEDIDFDDEEDDDNNNDTTDYQI